jgi:hypothetical protein
MKKIFDINLITGMVFLFFIFAGVVNAEEQSAERESKFNWLLSTKGFYSTGLSESYFYDKSAVKGEYATDYFEVALTFQRYFHYQLTDGNSSYEYRSFNEAGILFALYIKKFVSLTGEYYRGDDFDNLTKNAFNAGIEFDLSPVILSADYSNEQFKYDMDYVTIKTKKQDYLFQLEYAFSDAFSADIGYTYSNEYFNTLGYYYYKNSIRAGFSDILTDNFFMLGGVSAGKDSTDYYIYGADCGIAVKIFSHYKLSLTYNINYYPADTTTSQKGSGGSGSGKQNPYLSADEAGESITAHSVSLGMTLTF